MGVRISELPSVSSANTDDSLVLNHGSETSRITVEALMESYLSDAGLVTESELSNYLDDYVSESALSDTLGSYLSGSDLPDYLSEYVTTYDLSDALSSYVERSYLSEA